MDLRLLNFDERLPGQAAAHIRGRGPTLFDYGRWRSSRHRHSGIVFSGHFGLSTFSGQAKWEALGIFVDGIDVAAIAKTGPRSTWVPIEGCHKVEVQSVLGKIVFVEQVTLNGNERLHLEFFLPKSKRSDQNIVIKRRMLQMK